MAWGCGLWIVRELVKAHGGQVMLTSELGEGTTVTVTLPRQERPRTRMFGLRAWLAHAHR
jgi:two-component system sensor histidine kinase VicK